MEIMIDDEELWSLRRRFDAYMRRVIKNGAIDAVKKEISFRNIAILYEALEEAETAAYEEEGFDIAESEIFHLYGHDIRILDEQLASCIHKLRNLRSSIILLGLAGFSDDKICSVLNVKPSTVYSERSRAHKDIERLYGKDQVH